MRASARIVAHRQVSRGSIITASQPSRKLVGDHRPPPGGIEERADAACRLRDACAQPREAQARELPPERPLRQCQILSQIEVSRRGAPDLAARGLRDRAGLHQDDFVGRPADDVGRDLLRAHFQGRLRGRVALVGLGQDHDALGAGGRIGDAEGGDAVLAQAGNGSDRFLDLVRRDVLAGADDDVLDPAGDEEVAARHIGAVAGVEPAVVEQLTGLGRVAEIARGRRRTAKFEAALPALAELSAHIVDDADLVLGDRMAAGDDLDGVEIIRPAGSAIPRVLKADSIDAVDQRRRPGGGKVTATAFSASP